MKDEKAFCFAGLWERWVKPPAEGKPDTDLSEPPPSDVIHSFTVITTSPNVTVAKIHDRMPVILRASQYHAWLCNDPDPGYLRGILKPFDGPMEGYAVSPIVNSPRNDLPACLMRV